MSTQFLQKMQRDNGSDKGRWRDRWIAGIALVAIGALVLIVQFAESEVLGLLLLSGLGLIFLIWGCLVRSVGLLISGGVLSGIGLGAYLIAGPLSHLDGEGGVFLLSFAAGWALITLLSALICRETHWWPLIPGGIMALIGGALLGGSPGLTALDWASRVWPLIPIGFGLYLLLRRHKGDVEEDDDAR